MPTEESLDFAPSTDDPGTPPPLDLADRCQRFVARVEQIRTQHLIAGVLALGQAAVDELYAGDLAATRDRTAAFDTPLRLLLDQYGERLAFLGVTVDQVRAAIRAWDINLSLPHGVQGQLTPSHLRALAVVPSVADRAELAVRALEQTWTVDKTEAEVAQFRLRHGLGGKGGRPPLPAVVKRAGALQRAAKALGKKPDFKDLDVKARAQLRKDLESARAVLDAWLAGL